MTDQAVQNQDDKKAQLLSRLQAKKTAATAARAANRFAIKNPSALEGEGKSLVLLAKALGTIPADAEADPALFSGDGASPDQGQKAFFTAMEAEAYRLVRLLLLAQEDQPAARPVDMALHLTVSPDGVRASAFVLPPILGGKCLTPDDLAKKLQAEGIQFGRDTAPLLQALEEGVCLKLFTVAQGQPGRDGIDGTVVDRFARSRQVSYRETDGNVDYRNLHWVQKITEGEIICDLTQPVPPQEGKTVYGSRLVRKTGRMPSVPMGENTRVNPEGTALVAVCAGQLNFVAGKFRVDKVLRIQGDVDNSVGNLDVTGDLDIGGNVRDGFSLRATGNIFVRGLVEEATLEAGGNVHVTLGIKGNGKGSITAQGGLVCRYIENARVRADQGITANNIINSRVSSGDFVSAVSGHGVIVGGTVAARNKIEAKVIGNESGRATELSVGADPAVLEQIVRLTRELEAKERGISADELNIGYLEKAEKLDKTYQELLSRLKLKRTVDRMSVDKKKKKILALEQELDDSGCQITAGVIYAHTSVEIGGKRLVLKTANHMCRVYKDHDEIKLGTK